MEKKKKVCIVGCAKSKAEVPWHDTGMEFWGVNNLFLTPDMQNRPFSRWFEIHLITIDEYGRYLRRFSPEFRGQSVKDYLIGLSGLKMPVYMQQQWDIIPNSVVYPAQEILSKFPRNYFTNTISWQLAFAIAEGFEEIYVYGVDMAVGSEYEAQRPSCEYFLGIAEGLGIKVFIPDTADLLKTRFLYGFHELKASAWDNKLNSAEKSIGEQEIKARQTLEQARDKLNQAMGAKMAIKEMRKVWG